MQGYQGRSWIMEILSEIEEDAIRDQWNFDFSVAHNIAVLGLQVPDIGPLYCPSRRTGIETSPQLQMLQQDPSSDPAGLWGGSVQVVAGGTDYGACYGSGNCFNNEFKGFHTGWGCVGPAKSVIGVIVPKRGAEMGDIIDGTSSTILLGELQRNWSGETDTGTSGGIASRSWDGWFRGGAATAFTTYAISRDNFYLQSQFGVNLGEGFNVNGINSESTESAGSDHPGGAQFAFADGSARFISENIDPLIYFALGTRAGEEVPPGSE